MAVIGAFNFPNLLVNHAEMNGRSALTNGLEAVLKYNPVTRHVLPLVLRPFRQNLALAPGAAGVLDGDYEYRVVPYNENEDEEGPCYPYDEEVAAYRVTANSQRVTVSRAALRRDSTEITHWRIYRTVAGGSWPTMARVATVAWASATYSDNVDDAALDFINQGINIFIQVPPPKPFICLHNNRLFMWGDIPYEEGTALVTNASKTVVPAAGAVFGFHLEGKEFHSGTDGRAYIIDEYNPTTGNLTLVDAYGGTTGTRVYRICGDADTLIWSEPFFENQWPAVNNLPIAKKENDKPAGLVGSGSSLYLPKSEKTYILFYNNNPALPYSNVAILSDEVGCISHRGIRLVGGAPVWPSKKGIVRATQQGVSLMSRDALGSWFEDNTLLGAEGTQQMCCAEVLPERGEYICFFPSLQARVGCDRAVIWQYQDNKFTTFSFLTEFSCAQRVRKADGRTVVVLGDVNGYLWEYPYGDSDGPPAAGTVAGAVSQYGCGSPPFLFDADAQFPTSGLGLAGMAVYIYEGVGQGQTAIIAGNTVDTLFLETCFIVTPDATSRYYIGAIVARYKTGWQDFGSIDRAKLMRYAHLVFEKQDSDVRFNIYGDFSAVPADLTDTNPRLPVASRQDEGLVNMAGDDQDAENPRGRKRIKLGGVRRTHLAWEVFDDKPRNPWSLYDMAFDLDFKEP
jgi:hypothetical protein